MGLVFFLILLMWGILSWFADHEAIRDFRITKKREITRKQHILRWLFRSSIMTAILAALSYPFHFYGIELACFAIFAFNLGFRRAFNSVRMREDCYMSASSFYDRVFLRITTGRWITVAEHRRLYQARDEQYLKDMCLAGRIAYGLEIVLAIAGAIVLLSTRN